MKNHACAISGTKSGTPGADSVKAKAAITWVGAADGVQAEVRLFDRLFSDPQPDAGGKNFLDALNPDNLKVVTAVVEPSLGRREAGTEIPIRTPRLLRGRPRGPRRGREGGVQSGDGVEGFLG